MKGGCCASSACPTRLASSSYDRNWQPLVWTSRPSKRTEKSAEERQQQQPSQHGQGRGANSAGNASLADMATSWRRTGAAEERGKSEAKAEKAALPRRWKPKVDSYLVLDVEATCERGKVGQARKASFEFPNEIIEFPVFLLQWTLTDDGQLELHTRDVFHSYVRPVWRPRLTQFCRDLTGIRQEDIDEAPSFAEAVDRLHAFLASHNLLEAGPTRQILSRRAKSTPSPFLRPGVCWVTHGPFDLLHFVVKQSYISRLAEGVPSFLRGPLIDVKLSAIEISKSGAPVVVASGKVTSTEESSAGAALAPAMPAYPFRDTTVDGLLALLELEPFQGRHHSGLDDTRNIARIFSNVASRVANIATVSVGRDDDEMTRTTSCVEEAASLERATLLPNTQTEKAHLRRWDWMCSKEPGRVIWDDPEEA